LQTLKTIKEVYGDINVTLARELTKKFEEIKTRKVSEHLQYYISKNPKGEFVVLFKSI
jgi:16S rRNA (cytidine1402-2'-O)-methyltransferase